MEHLLQALAVALVLLISCHARELRSEDSDLQQDSSFHSFEGINDFTEDGAKLAKAIQEARLMKLREDALVFRNWLAQVSYSADELEKRFKPSGFLGSRGKRFIPGFEPLLLARYYQDAEKWKRQPHLGFHGSRG